MSRTVARTPARRSAGHSSNARGTRAGRAARPTGSSAARRLLEVLEPILGWTSSERDRARSDWDLARRGSPEDWRGFQDRLVGWASHALERRSDPVESARLQLLLKLTEAVRDTTDAAAALGRALELLGQAVSYESATFFLYDRVRDTLVPAATAGGHVDLIPEIQFDLGAGLSSWVARTRKPVLLSELRGEDRDDGVRTRPGSFLSVPLVVQQQLVGVLNVGHRRAGAFTPADRDVLTAAGAILAAALERQIAFEELRRAAASDELTGLRNRRSFEERLAEAIEEARRYGHVLSLVILDVDRFGAVNRSYGRAYGDACLVSLAGLLRRLARKSDVLARCGPGDEFAILLPHTGPEQARVAASRFAAAVESHTFPSRRKLTVTTGVATFPHDAVEPDALVARADLSLHEAKCADAPTVEVPGTSAVH